MLNCSVKKRKQILKKQKKQMESRILTGKQTKMDPEEKARIREVKLKERFDFEMKHKGAWELIYPWPDKERNEVYGDFIKKANEIWDEFNLGKGKKNYRGKIGLMDEKRSKDNNNNFNRQTTSKNTIQA